MMKLTPLKTTATVCMSTIAVLLIAIPANANQSPMRITDVRFADLGDESKIEVVGTLFDAGDFPIVTLDGVPIEVTGASASVIQAVLPGTTLVWDGVTLRNTTYFDSNPE